MSARDQVHADYVEAMRSWAKENGLPEDEDGEFIDGLSDEAILDGVDRHYAGSIEQFVRDEEGSR